MSLEPSIVERIRAEAVKRGVDPDAAIARADSRPASRKPAKAEAVPLVDKLLIGHLPFVKVRELRELLGLTERVPDDELMCGEFAAKHGGASASPGTGGPPA